MNVTVGFPSRGKEPAEIRGAWHPSDMTIDQVQLDEFRKTLEADDYHLSIEVDGDEALARIEAGPDACAECLVPKDFMRQMLSPLLGVGAERIRVDYPVDVHTSDS